MVFFFFKVIGDMKSGGSPKQKRNRLSIININDAERKSGLQI